MMFRCLIVAILVGITSGVPVDNGVVGDPEIECGPTYIRVNFNTENNFEGHVYVKNLYADQACRTDETGRASTGIQLPFDTCNVQRTRSLNPRGVFVSVTVVVSFHPLFMTKVDRAYTVQCFYMEADKTVSQDIEVSMITTVFQTQVVPMPICRYEILAEGPTGQPVDYALIGDQVYHKWTCDSDTVDTFCMVVHTCYVDDGNEDRVDLIDTDGCGLDKHLLNNPEYPSDLMAGVEAHVFKYADRPQLYFTCQVTISVKDPDTPCLRPQCAEPEGRGGRKRRSTHQFLEAVGYTDVRTDLNTLDISEQSQDLPRTLSDRPSHSRYEISNEGLCLSTGGFGMLLALAMTLIISLIALISYVLLRRH